MTFMRCKLILFLSFFLFILFSCKEKKEKNQRVVIVQPLGDIDSSLVKIIYSKIKEINPLTVLKNPMELPGQAWYPIRKRFRADTLIHFLSRFATLDSVVIGLTNQDISTTKGSVADWGIMGLGYCPGKACIASTYRVSKANLEDQFYKVAIHELGHTQGLPHCDKTSCFMRDAEGGNPLNDEKEFCNSCKSYLIKKGWRLN